MHGTFEEPPTGLIPWFSNRGKHLSLLCCITLSSSREKPTQAQEVARRISGVVAGEIYAKSSIASTQHKLFSLALHYLPFASRFPLPHFTFAVLFALFSVRVFLLASCVTVCCIDCLSRWLKIILNCVTFPIPTTIFY